MCLKNKLTWVDDGSGVTEILYRDTDMFTGRRLEGLAVSATPRTAQAPPSTAPRARGPGYKLFLPLTRGRERDLVPSTYQRPAAKTPESVLLSVLLYSKSSSGVAKYFEYTRWSRPSSGTAIQDDH
jgi:hypothetical protein